MKRKKGVKLYDLFGLAVIVFYIVTVVSVAVTEDDRAAKAASSPQQTAEAAQ